MISWKAPQTKYDSFNEIGKFNMLWDVCIVLTPIFFALFAIHLYLGNLTWVTSLIACLFAAVCIVILNKTRKYKAVSVFVTIVGVLMIQSLIYFVEDSQLISDVLWSVLISYFSFFLFNSWVGTIILLVNISSMLIFNSLYGVVNIARGVDAQMVIDVIYVSIALAYVVHKMMQNNKFINSKYEEENARNKILLKEIHHRVKNNLQIVSSLLRLQSAELDEEAKTQFNEAIGRIRSMALIHERMYGNYDLSKIDLQSYIRILADDITETMTVGNKINFNINSDLKRVDIKSMVTISLIFNELITNSLKHGLNESDDGKIVIKITSNDGKTKFEYSDNGEWKTPQKESSFGLELLTTLTEQLDGSFTRTTDGGTKYHFVFNTRSFFFDSEEV